MDKTSLIRIGSLYLPLAVAFVLWVWRQPSRRLSAGILLGCAWNIWSLFALHLLAVRFGWWSFQVQGGVFWGFPFDFYIGWTILWGALPGLAFSRLAVSVQVAILFFFDLLLMPMCEPAVRLGRYWLLGEVVGLGLCLLPAILLMTATRDNTHLRFRAWGQILSFAGVFGFLTVAIAVAPGSPQFRWAGWPVIFSGLALQSLLLPGVLFVAAVLEFAQRGGGTPIPFDPPSRLVTSGPYAYISNPMQFSMVLYLAMVALFLGNLKVLAASMVGLCYSVGLAAWDEESDLQERFGERWAIYRKNVRPWRFRLRPWHPHVDGLQSPARLYVAAGCAACSSVGAWFTVRRPVGLAVLAAEDHPDRDLDRITYDPGDGSSEVNGIRAIACALEHIHLYWAFLGWVLRIPFVDHLAQTMLDAIGWGPMRVPRRSPATTA
jgi:protein-S-isoprenylcysteine O-methyltransferase Ste14